MGDPIEVILEFLQRHRFTKAEAALKAELCARLEAHGPLPPSLSDDLDRDSTMQLLSTPDNALSVEAEHGPLPRGSLSSTPELIVCQEQELREEDSAFLPGRPRSTSEKHMYVEDEPQELQDQQTRHAPGNESRLQNIQNMQEQGQPYHPGSQLKAETPQRGQADFPVVKLIIEQKQVREDVAASQDMGFRVSLHCTSEMPDVGSLQGLQALNSRNVGIDSEEQAVLSPNGEMQDSDEFIRNVQAAGPQVKLVSKSRLPQDLSFKQSPDDGNYLSKRHLDPMFGENSGLQHHTKPYEMDGARWEEKSALLQFEKTTMPERVPMVVEPSQSCEISFQEPRERASSQSSVKGEECTKNGFVSNFTHQGFQKDSPLQTTLPVSLVYPSLFEAQRSVRPDKWDVKEKDIRVTSETAVGTPEVIDCSQKSNGGPMNLHYIKRETSETDVGTPEVIDCSQKSNGGPMNLHYIKRVEVEDLPCSNGSLRNTAGELPRLPPVRLHSLDKSLESSKEGSGAGTSTRSFDSAAFLSLGSTPEGIFGLGAFLDIPLGQDTIVTGMKRPNARPSVSQGIVEDTSEHLSGFATAGDGQSESAKENIDEYWDSDTYEDDDDPGYLRQPIEDEVWFLAHEIDYPSEDERARNLEEDNHRLCKEFDKLNDDDPSFVEEESYFSGEEYYRSKRADSLVQSESEQLTYSNLYPLGDDNKIAGLRSHKGSEYSSHMMDSEELIMMKSDSVWNGVMGQYKMVEVEEIGCADDRTHDLYPPEGDDNYRHDSVRSGALGGSSDAADIGSEVRESLFGESSEGDAENFREQELPVYGPAQCRFDQASILHDISSGKETRHVEVKSAPVRHFDDDDDEEHHRMILSYYGEPWCHKERRKEKQVLGRSTIEQGSLENNTVGSNYDEDANNKNEEDNDCLGFGGFSFPSPSSTGDLVASRAESGKSPWSTRDSTAPGEETDEYQSGVIGPDDTLAAWKRNSNESSPLISSRDENLPNLSLSNQSMLSAHSTDGFARIKTREGGFELQDVEQFRENTITAADDEDSASALEQIRMSGCQEDEYEIFDLRIIHRKNRTGFEEDKDFPVVINSVIAGRYHVTEYLGSAAFSKAIQAHDLFTGVDVCMKIIKNSKDFFDQSLDEIKLLKFINKHDPSDKYHTLRLYDYFYHREHLFIVCELLRANLYEFHKYNRESGGEVYFTMPRLQSISRQCLEALEFLHGLGLIHCDLKPENILVKSYSHCEIKVIDLGSSCFQTDHLCSYVQSRSYRAPEVILGLPYGQKIDIWSLGCILAELCTGNVLFQNDSLATLLARLVGILGPIDPEMLAKGCDTHKYFTKNHMLYERNQDSNQLEYLLPKKTSLRHRLPMGDEGFVEFVASLLQVNPANRPSAAEALKHPWLLYPYEPFSS